ncbi:F-box family protein [Striga asiatica]|uniref:F-box family protein n=1 Tax=Striga asiatica TaxID=4170 RepID=A0A5A7PKH5_STRAF|nr:F-box family protein [Striga asiatica]
MEPFYTPISIPNISYSFTSIPHNNTGNLASPWMDPRIWSRLPQRLLDRILASLPPPAFFRSRAVCKRWYSLIFSPTFLELYLHASPRRHWFLFFNHQNTLNNIYKNKNHPSRAHVGYLLDPENLKWYRLPIPGVPPGFSPASSSGGLVCWVSDDGGSKTVLLGNPLVVGNLIQLPSTLKARLCPSVGMAVTDSSIDLILAGDDLISPYAVKNLTSESFHVDSGGFYSIWGTTAALPRLCSLESGRMVDVGGGRFYCMNYSPYSVLSYEAAGNRWGKIQAPMRRFLRSPGLVECRGRLLLVAAVEKSKLNVPRSLRLWALQDCGTAWAEIERMPQQLYGQFAEMEGGRGFGCVAGGDFVLVMVKGSKAAIMFDFGDKSWTWVPPCLFVNSEDDAELNGFAYGPRIAVPITGLLHQLTMPFNTYAS